MEQFVNSPIVQQVFFYILGVITPLIIQYAFKRKAKPQWAVIKNSPILVDNGMERMFKVTYGDRVLSKLSLMEIMIINNGRLSFRKGDVAKPIQLSYDRNVEIIDVVNVIKSNDTINVSFEHIGSRWVVTVTFDYLSAKEGVCFSVLHTGDDKDCFRIDAEFIDHKFTQPEDDTKKFNRTLYSIMIIFGLLSISGAIFLNLKLLIPFFVMSLPFFVIPMIARIQNQNKLPKIIKNNNRIKNIRKVARILSEEGIFKSHR